MTLYLKVGGQAVPVTGGDPFPITPWTAVTFENSWVNYGAPFQEVEYRRFGDNVQLRGVAKDGTAGTDRMFTLPVGFRPPANAEHSVRTAGAPGGVLVTPDGSVIPQVGASTSSCWVTGSFSLTATGEAPAFTTGEDTFAGEHVLTGDPLNPPTDLALGQLLWDGQDGEFIGLPPGGTTGQALRKLSDDEQDAGWTDDPVYTGPRGIVGEAKDVGLHDTSGPTFLGHPRCYVTFNAEVGRKYRWIHDAMYYTDQAWPTYNIVAVRGLLFRPGVEELNPNIRGNLLTPGDSNSVSFHLEGTFTVTATDAYTAEVQMAEGLTGMGTIHCYGNPAFPFSLTIEDIGPA